MHLPYHHLFYDLDHLLLRKIPLKRKPFILLNTSKFQTIHSRAPCICLHIQTLIKMDHLRTHNYLILIKNTIHLDIPNMISSSVRVCYSIKETCSYLPPSQTKAENFVSKKSLPKKLKYAISPLICVWRVCSSFERPSKSSLASKPISSNNKLFFLNAKSLNSSLFHFFKLFLRAFNFQAKIKLGEPKNSTHSTIAEISPQNPRLSTTFFSNLKALRPLLKSPDSTKSGQ